MFHSRVPLPVCLSITMLSRLSSSSRSLLRAKSSSIHTSKATRGRSLKTKSNLASHKPLSSSFITSSQSLISPLATKTFSKTLIRSYASKASLSQVQLEDALSDSTKQAVQDFDAEHYEDLLEKNGWTLVLKDTELSLVQEFEDATVTVEIFSEAEDIQSAMKKALDLQNQEDGYIEHHDHDHDHHDHGEEGDDFLKGQNDFFSVVVSKKDVQEKLIFTCNAKEGTIMIEQVVITSPSYVHKHGQITSAGVKMTDLDQKLAVERMNRTSAFIGFDEALRSSVENYLLEHGINHDMAEIVYLSLYKADLQYDQEFSSRVGKFLRASSSL